MRSRGAGTMRSRGAGTMRSRGRGQCGVGGGDNEE